MWNRRAIREMSRLLDCFFAWWVVIREVCRITEMKTTNSGFLPLSRAIRWVEMDPHGERRRRHSWSKKTWTCIPGEIGRQLYPR